MHAGVAAEFCVSVRAPAHAAEPMGAVRSFVDSRPDQLFRAGPRQQHARVPDGLCARWIEEPARCTRRTPWPRTYLPSPNRRRLGELPTDPARIWADGQQFRGAHQIVPVAKGTPGAVRLLSSGRLLPGQEVRIVSDSGAILGEGMSARFWSKRLSVRRLLQPSRPDRSGDRRRLVPHRRSGLSVSGANSMWSAEKKTC